LKQTINMKKILVVGYGSIGKRHVENLLSISNLEIIVCTKRNDINKLKNSISNISKEFSSLKELMSEDTSSLSMLQDAQSSTMIFLEIELSFPLRIARD